MSIDARRSDDQDIKQFGGRALGASGVLVAINADSILDDLTQATEASTENTPAGRWTGQTAQGGSVVIDIPPSGSPTYSFRGQKLPVSSARMANGSMVMMVGTGAGRVTLTPQTIGDRVLGEIGRALIGHEIRRPFTGIAHASLIRLEDRPWAGLHFGVSAACEAGLACPA